MRCSVVTLCPYASKEMPKNSTMELDIRKILDEIRHYSVT